MDCIRRRPHAVVDIDVGRADHVKWGSGPGRVKVCVCREGKLKRHEREGY